MIKDILTEDFIMNAPNMPDEFKKKNLFANDLVMNKAFVAYLTDDFLAPVFMYLEEVYPYFYEGRASWNYLGFFVAMMTKLKSSIWARMLRLALAATLAHHGFYTGT